MGFIMRPAQTQAQIERMRLLPVRKFVARTKDGMRYFIYADPDYCRCVFVGNEVAMKNYQAFISPPATPPMPTGPDPGTVSDGWVQIDPRVDTMPGYGDIFDYSY